MAKDAGSDGYNFVPPDFDEDAFIHKEMVAFKTTSILFVWAIIAAAAAWAVFRLLKGDFKSAWPASIAVCAAFGLALKPLFRRFTDISHFKRGNWVGTGILFFFCWLAFFTVALNVPLSDDSPPQVMVAADPPVQAEGGQVDIHFLASDNSATPGYTLEVTRDGAPLLTVPAVAQDRRAGHYAVILASPDTVPGHYVAKLTSTDSRGHASPAAQANFTVQAGDFLTVRTPAGGNLTAAGGDEVFVFIDAKPCTLALPPCLRTVYFEPTGGGEAVPFEYSEVKSGWIATAAFDKWKSGPNTGRIAADFMDHYQGPLLVEGIPGPDVMRSKETYTFNVQPPSERHEVTVLPTVAPRQAPIPAYGPIGVLASLLGVALVLRPGAGPSRQRL